MLYATIKRLCDEAGITVSALEKQVGLGNATIKGWEKSYPRVDKLKKVAVFFNRTVDEILEEA